MNNTLLVLEKAKKAITEYSMLESNDTVIVGLSGGADSVCLLHLLNSLKDEYNLNIIAAHINHGIRKDEAKRDALFSEGFSKELDVDFKLLEVDCVAEAKKTGEGVEEAGRRIRYEFFESLATSKNTRIATAHNSNDNMETVIFNLTRGASLSGATGIPPKRSNIIRPLIFCSRVEIEGYCSENNLKFVTDSTNLHTDYTRNKIRHLVIPELLKINDSAQDAFSRFSYLSRQDLDYINEGVRDAFLAVRLEENRYNAKKLLTYHDSIKSRVLIRAVNEFCGENLDSKKLQAIFSSINENTKIQLYKNCYCETKGGVLTFFSDEEEKEAPQAKVVLNSDFCCDFGEFIVKAQKYTNNSKKVKNSLLDNLIDCDTICGNLVLRTRREGDKITLAKRKVTKTLKKLFIEADIPKSERLQLPVLADDNGIVWVYGFGVNKRNIVTENTKNIIFIEAGKNDNE